MWKLILINNRKLEDKELNYNISPKRKTSNIFWKSMFLVAIINIFLGLKNIEKYFINDYYTYDNTLSKFEKNDHMNVALAARSYDQISDYLSSKKGLDNGYQIINNGKIVAPDKDFPTCLGYRKTIKIYFSDMKEEKGYYYLNYIKDMLNKNYEFIYEKQNPDYLIFSFYGCSHNDPKYKDAIKIAIYEEGFSPSFLEEDYVFGLAHIFYLDRYFRRSTLIEFLQSMKLKNIDFREARQKALKGQKRKKFCGTIINYEINRNLFREKFMMELSKYKPIDNGGNILNNIGYNVTDKIQFLNSYKFSMAFEKNSADGFSTEHILYALLAGTVPIYYGDYLIDEYDKSWIYFTYLFILPKNSKYIYINPNTYILVKNDEDLNEKIEYIKKVDQDEELYKNFLLEDVLIDENIVRKRKKDEKNYWNHIFRQDKFDAKRIDQIWYKTRKCMNKK